MKTTERFEKAVNKLYNAFNNGTLNAMDCKQCAVGNLCDNSSDWIDNYNAPQTGYSSGELERIEEIFMNGKNKEWCRRGSINQKDDPELVFKALIQVIDYLAELDGIETIETQYNKFKKVLDREKEIA